MSNKIIFIFLMVTLTASELFPSYPVYGPQDPQSPHKIILRSKRQQCVCVSVVFPIGNSISSSSNFQCSCDASGRPVGFVQQQQDLQKELSYMQQTPTQDSFCGCQLNPANVGVTTATPMWSAIHFGTTASPYLSNPGLAGNGVEERASSGAPLYDCQCVHVDSHATNLQSPETNQQPRQQQLQYSPTQAPVPPTPEQIAVTTTPIAVPPAATVAAPIALADQGHVQSLNPGEHHMLIPRCKCVEIIVKFSSERQFQCDCGNGPQIVNGNTPEQIQQYQQTYTPVDPYALPGMNPAQPTTPNFVQQPPPTVPTATTASTTTTTVTPQTTPTTTTTTAPLTLGQTTQPLIQFPDNGIGSYTQEPDAVPCVMIQIRTGARVCACQENFRQCTDNICCNMKRFSALADDPKPAPLISPATATVDLLVDLLGKIRQSLI